MMVTSLPQSRGRKAPASPAKKNGATKSSTLQLQPPKAKTEQNLQHEAVEFPSGAKSPIKKHLKNAAMTKWQSNPASPTQHTQPTTRAQAPQAKQVANKQTPVTTSASSAAKMATLRYTNPIKYPIVDLQRIILTKQLHGHVRVSLCRASIIQMMLGLLDQDQDTVQGTIPILQALAALPLENPSVRHECQQMLQKIYKSSFSPSKQQQQDHQAPQDYDPRFDAASDIPTSEGDGGNDSDRAGFIMPPSFVYEYGDTPPSASSAVGKRSGRSMKDSGRAKSLSLHHCKEFLLACANEIHELEDENPNFDYAEDTSSETTSGGQRRHRKSDFNKNSNVMTTTMLEILTPHSRFSSNGNRKWRATDFDYASTAASSASVVTEIALNDDLEDVQGDQGSEFSEVVRRADYLSDFDSDDEVDGNGDQAAKQRAVREIASVRDRVLCRQAMHQLQKKESSTSSSSIPRELLLLKHRVFTALKQNGLQSRRNASRKQFAFQFLTANLQQMRIKRNTMTKLRIAASRSSAHTTTNGRSAINKLTTTGGHRPMLAPLDTSTRMKMLLSQHLDLVFVVLCAVFMLSMLS